MSDTTANVLGGLGIVAAVIAYGLLWRWRSRHRPGRANVIAPVGHGGFPGVTGHMEVQLTDEELDKLYEVLKLDEKELHDEHEGAFV